MPADIQITVESELIRVVYRGKVEIGVTTEMLRKVARIASENQRRLLLFDIREADYRNYYAETIKHTEDGPSLGIDQTFRVAFLGSEGEPMLAYIENVTVNRGYESKAFTDQSAAVAWLRSAL